MRRRGWLATGAVTSMAAGLFVAGAAADTLSGSIDQAGNISGPTGTIAPGTYDYQVSDTATVHNYHLAGPGVDRATGVAGTGSVTWSGLTFSAGTYLYQCDVHPAINGSFTVGSGPPPPPPPQPPPPPPAPPPSPPAPKSTKLLGSVGPGSRIDLKTITAKRVRSLAAGLYIFVVSDRTAFDNFHLSGPGVDRKSTVKGKGTLRWPVRLKAGAYRYRSDSHAKLRGSFTVKQSG